MIRIVLVSVYSEPILSYYILLSSGGVVVVELRVAIDSKRIISIPIQKQGNLHNVSLHEISYINTEKLIPLEQGLVTTVRNTYSKQK